MQSCMLWINQAVVSTVYCASKALVNLLAMLAMAVASLQYGTVLTVLYYSQYSSPPVSTLH